MSNVKWYAAIGGKQAGPFSEAELLALVDRKEVTGKTLVWRAGWSSWQPLSTAGLVAPVITLRSSTSSLGSTDVLAEFPAEAYGGFWIRFVAHMIDGFCLFFPQLIVNVVAILTLGNSTGQAVGFLFNAATGFLYYSILQGRMQGSFGKRVMGLTLLNEDLTPISASTAVRRYIIMCFAYIPLAAGLIAVAFNNRKQGWHDRVAKTVVVKKAYLEALRAPRPTTTDRLAA